MAVKGIATVTDVLSNEDTTSLNIYIRCSAHDQSAEITLTGVAVGTNSEAAVWSTVVTFVKTYMTANMGVTFTASDTVELYHPARTAL